MTLASLVALLQLFETVTVVGQATTLEQAQLNVALQPPTMLLIDVDQPDGPDLSAAVQLRHTYPSLPIAVSTLFADGAFLHTLISYHIQACLTKDLSPQQFLRALEIVAAGGSFFSPAVTAQLQQIAKDDKTAYPPVALTLREQELFHLLYQGVSFPTIAGQLHLSEQTARNYASVLYGKLGVASKAELVARYGCIR